MVTDTISWKGMHTEDWPAWAAVHREVGAREARLGHAALAAKHESIAQKYDRRAERAAKKLAKSPEQWPFREAYHREAAESHRRCGDIELATRHEQLALEFAQRTLKDAAQKAVAS